VTFATVWVDVAPYLAAGVAPVYLLERPLAGDAGRRGGVFSETEVARLGAYWCPRGDLVGGDPAWSVALDGDFARVPLHAYRVSAYSYAAVFALGVQLGAEALAGFARLGRGEPSHLTLVCGNRVDDLGDAFRAYLGLCVRVD
jgi:hypothetical protein